MLSKIGKFFKSPGRFFYDAYAKRLAIANNVATETKKFSKPAKKLPAAKYCYDVLPANVRNIFLTNANVTYRHIEVAVYFYGSLATVYQLEQWYNTFSILDEKHEVLFIVRNKSVFQHIAMTTKFRVSFAHTIHNLTDLYDKNNFKVILYVNNGVKNFQSLMHSGAFHVHINHGESEKASMSSNQAKAYDYVLTVGNAGIDRYRKKLLKFDAKKFIKVGRPQLDFIESHTNVLNPSLPTLLYAPTWEATHELMNYSSLSAYGFEMFKLIFDSNKFNIIYKPHPATGSLDKEVLNNHNKIKDLIRNHLHEVNENREIIPRLEIVEKTSINSVFKAVDIAVFDNSSVMIDYLVEDKPILLTNRFKEKEEKFKIVDACQLVDDVNYLNIVQLLIENLENDYNKSIRNEIKEYYIGDYKEGESTGRFVNVIGEFIKERDLEIEKDRER